jgi:hypothetical protein
MQHNFSPSQDVLTAAFRTEWKREGEDELKRDQPSSRHTSALGPHMDENEYEDFDNHTGRTL